MARREAGKSPTDGSNQCCGLGCRTRFGGGGEGMLPGAEFGCSMGVDACLEHAGAINSMAAATTVHTMEDLGARTTEVESDICRVLRVSSSQGQLLRVRAKEAAPKRGRSTNLQG